MKALPPADGAAPVAPGANLTGRGGAFGLLSANATGVDLCLFDEGGVVERSRVPMTRGPGDVWQAEIPGIGAGQLYGYRVHGPYEPLAGHRFNPNKLLLDPCARLIRGTVTWDDAVYGFDQGSPESDRSFDGRDSAPFVPRSVVVDPRFDWGGDAPPRRPWADTLIYEAHVKGLTRLHPDVPPEVRGTVEALAHPAIVGHLLALGVTAVELLPIQAFADDRFLVRRGLTNYWGYSPLGYFAPDPRYLGPSGPSGLKAAIRALHAAGIEVILDVVFNHTAELEETGPTLSFRGIDNAVYYKPAPGDLRRTFNCTGCGNALDLGRPAVVRHVLDALRLWAGEYHVDGFRFDLATTLARNPYAFDRQSPFLTGIASDPVLSRVKLIAEPWDIGEGGYRLGQFPPGFSEWNDLFRDPVRRFWRGDGGQISGFVRALSGSREVFEASGRGPLASVNYVTSHDGYTLEDLVSYEERHNWANGEENRDGHGANHSANHGVEGPTGDPAILALRRRQKRNLLATVFLAQGVPMLLMGDELGHSQGGNNNAYCQDNATTWLDWSAPDDPDLTAFVARLAELRRSHPALRRETFLLGIPDPATGSKDVRWLTSGGAEMADGDWHDGERRALGVELGGSGAGDARPLLLLVNAGPHAVAFALPPLDAGGWRAALDTTVPTGIPRDPGRSYAGGGTFTSEPRSVVFFRGSDQAG